MDENLLTPELTRVEARKPLYSTRANVLVAFFGGPVAITLFSALNSSNSGRLRQDLPFYAAGLVIALGILVYVLAHPAAAGDDSGPVNFRIVNRALALLLFGVYYLRLKPNYRAAELLGGDPPSPWAPALLCIVAAAFIGIVVVTIYGMVSGVGFVEALRGAAGR